MGYRVTVGEGEGLYTKDCICATCRNKYEAISWNIVEKFVEA